MAYHARRDVAHVPFDDAGPVEYALMWRDEVQSAALRAAIGTLLDSAPSRT